MNLRCHVGWHSWSDPTLPYGTFHCFRCKREWPATSRLSPGPGEVLMMLAAGVGLLVVLWLAGQHEATDGSVGCGETRCERGSQ